MKVKTAKGLRTLSWLAAVATWGLPAIAQEKSPQQKPPAEWDTTKARGQTRDIDFDTSEGTWMALSLSPDGNGFPSTCLGTFTGCPRAAERQNASRKIPASR